MTTTGISRPDGATKVLTELTIISYLGLPAFIEDPFPAYRFFLGYPECDVSGQFFASTAGSMRLVFASATRGYQSPDPEAFTIEELRDHWELACSREPALIPASTAEFNDFRRSILNEKVVHP